MTDHVSAGDTWDGNRNGADYTALIMQQANEL